jgi:DEAD/DEAH box helicase domain-containing protein
VVSQVVGFKKIKFHTHENVGAGDLTMPENEMHTTAYWLTVPRELMRELPFALDERRDGVVALSYTLGQMAALHLMCDRHDLGVAVGDNGQGEARLERGLLRFGRGAACPCEDGCPSCVGPVGEVGSRGKEVALRLLERILA